MSKKSSTEFSPLLSIIQSLRPEGAAEYRLLDAENRLFPPSEQPAYRAIPRIEPPSVPPGRYAIRFEDGAGNVVSYAEDGALAEVELSGALMTVTPDSIRVRQERSWQKIEKKEIRHKAGHIRNEGLQGMMGIVLDSQRLLFEANKKVEQGHQHVADMMAQFAAMQTDLMGKFAVLQTSLLEQQQQLIQRAHQTTPPPPQENWATATPKILDKLGDVIKVAILATSQERKERKFGPTPIDVEATVPAALAPSTTAERSTAPARSTSALAADRAPQAALPSAAKEPESADAQALPSSAPAAPPLGLELPTEPGASAQAEREQQPEQVSIASGGTATAARKPAVAADSPTVLSSGHGDARAGARSPVRPAERAPTAHGSEPPEPPMSPGTASRPPASGSSAQSASTKSPAVPATSKRTPLGPDDPTVAGYYKAQAQMKLAQAFLPLASLAAARMWREMKRRIISLPDNQLSRMVGSRERFHSWLEWIAEPAQIMKASI